MTAEKNDPPASASASKSKAEEAAEDSSQPTAGPSSSAVPDEPPPPAYESSEAVAPTVSSPFNFPSNSDLPPYEPPAGSPSNQRPIAIPQLKPDPAIPFLSIYPPSLLSHGITQDTWHSFLDTISAFLTAKVSERAVSHAGDMAKHLAEDSKRFGKDLLAETKGVGKGIAKSVKRGDVIGAAGEAIGGVISLPLSFAFGLVGTVLALPASAVGAIVKKPKTPGQRAAAYAAVANEKWLHARGLHAQMLDSNELARLLGVPVTEFLSPSQQTKDRSAPGQLEALEGWIAPLEVKQPQATLELAPNTIWLVLAPMVRREGNVLGA
ncbi:hypothetical protein ACO1O0_000320 [Amphichorda felina]